MCKPRSILKLLGGARKAVRMTSQDPLQGQVIRVGSTLEYLLRVMSFDMMKAKEFKSHWYLKLSAACRLLLLNWVSRHACHVVTS